MKTTKTIIANLLIGVLGMVVEHGALAAKASCDPDAAKKDPNGFLAGSHRGVHKPTNQWVDLLMEPVEGREGSYLGALVQLDPKIVIYRIDQADLKGRYVMNPLAASAIDGEINVTDHASLYLSVAGVNRKTGCPIINISDGNTSNKYGFTPPINFDGKTKSPVQWTSLVAGVYKFISAPRQYKEKYEDDEPALADLDGAEAALTSLVDGTLNIRRILPKIFAIRGSKAWDTGSERDVQPKHVGLFVTFEGMFGTSQLFLLVNPVKDTDVIQYKLK